MKRPFEKVKKWNYLMGVPVKDSFTLPSPDDRNLATDLIIEEATELRDATDEEEVLDALADIQFVLYGAAARYGITAEKYKEMFDRVCKSNDSKFANTEEEAIQSIKKESKRLGIDSSLVNYVEVDGRFVIFRVDTNKVLKSVNYMSPEKFKKELI